MMKKLIIFFLFFFIFFVSYSQSDGVFSDLKAKENVKFTGLESGSETDSVMVIDPVSGNVKYVDSESFGGSGDPYDDSFDGDRPITNIPVIGSNFGTTDIKGWINAHYDVLPSTTLSVTPPTTIYEYNDGSVIPITFGYWAERPTGCSAITTATLSPPGTSFAPIIALSEGDDYSSTLAHNHVSNNSSTTYTFFVESATLSSTSTITIYTKDQRYWGVDPSGVLDNAEILQFETNGDSDFSSGYSSTGVVYDLTGVDNEHVVIAIPYNVTYPRRAKIGVLEADISSYFSIQSPGSFSLTTASGGTRQYKILVSLNKYGVSELEDVQVTLIQ